MAARGRNENDGEEEEYWGWDEIQKDADLREEFGWVNYSRLHRAVKRHQVRTRSHDKGGKNLYRYHLGDLRALKYQSSSVTVRHPPPFPERKNDRIAHLRPSPYVPGPFLWPVAQRHLSSWQMYQAWAQAIETSITGPNNVERTIIQPIRCHQEHPLSAHRRMLHVPDYLPGLQINRSLATIGYHYLRLLAMRRRQLGSIQSTIVRPPVSVMDAMLALEPINFASCSHETLVKVVLPLLESPHLFHALPNRNLDPESFQAFDLFGHVDRHLQLTGRHVGFLMAPDTEKKDEKEDDPVSKTLLAMLDMLPLSMRREWKQSHVLIETVTRTDGHCVDFVRLLSTLPISSSSPAGVDPMTDDEDDEDDDDDESIVLLSSGLVDASLPDRTLPIDGLFPPLGPDDAVDPLPSMDFLQLGPLPVFQRLSGQRGRTVANTERRLGRAIWHAK